MLARKWPIFVQCECYFASIKTFNKYLDGKHNFVKATTNNGLHFFEAQDLEL